MSTKPREASHVLHLRNLRLEVLKVELFARRDLLGELFGLLEVDRLLHVLHKGDDVAHAEDAAGHLFGVEGFKAVELFAHAHELDGLPGDHAHGKRRAAAAVAVELREDHAREIEPLVEGAGGVDRVLAQHGVDHEKRFGGLQKLGEVAYLLHHRLVDRKAPGRIDDQHVVEVAPCVIERIPGDVQGLLACFAREEVGSSLRRNGLQLFDGRGTIDVGRDREHLLLARFDEPLGKLARGGRLARALKAGQKNHRRGLHREVDLALFGRQVAADHLRQLALNDTHERLAGVEVCDHLFAHGLGLDAGDELTHHRQRNVGVKQRKAHLAQHRTGVFFGQAGLAAHGLQNARQTGTKVFKHREVGTK